MGSSKTQHPSKHKEATAIRELQRVKRQKSQEAEVERRSLYQLTSANQPTLAEVWSGTGGTKLTAERQKDLEKMLLQWIIDQMLPYTTVENEHFQQFVHGKIHLEIFLNSSMTEQFFQLRAVMTPD